ncbi:MAG: hypothetical protein HYU64_06635 [Armatimonadetes bacterium]|nr:hypothetical protein [Armatimonadota bacterium]
MTGTKGFKAKYGREMKPILYILLSVALGVIGQVLFKLGVQKGAPSDISLGTVRLLFTPLIMLGILCYVVSTLSWLTVLSQVKLSYAYPFLSLSYVLLLGIASIFFGETIPLLRLIGVAFIGLGIFFVGHE